MRLESGGLITVRLIDAEKFEVFSCVIPKKYRKNNETIAAYSCGTDKVLEAIDAAPTIDPESLRPTAHWINETDAVGGPIIWTCSACKEPIVLYEGTPIENAYNYCPTCGARMVNADA